MSWQRRSLPASLLPVLTRDARRRISRWVHDLESSCEPDGATTGAATDRARSPGCGSAPRRTLRRHEAPRCCRRPARPCRSRRVGRRGGNGHRQPRADRRSLQRWCAACGQCRLRFRCSRCSRRRPPAGSERRPSERPVSARRGCQIWRSRHPSQLPSPASTCQASSLQGWRRSRSCGPGPATPSVRSVDGTMASTNSRSPGYC